MRNQIIIKFALCALILLSGTAPIFSADFNPVHITFDPKTIKVYQTGAEATFDFKVNLKRGLNKIYIDSVFTDIDQNTIRIIGPGSIPIGLFNYAFEELTVTVPVERGRIRMLQDSLKKFDRPYAECVNRIGVLDYEDNLITSYKLNNKNDTTGVDVLVKLTNLVSTKLTEIRNERTDLKLKQEAIDRARKAIYSLIDSLNQDRTINRSNPQIMFELNTESTGPEEFHVKCYTPSASWQPVYDLIADNIKSPMKIVYKAALKQNSGVDWNNVSLIFSTGKPNNNSTLAMLTPWHLTLQKTVRATFEDSPLSPVTVAASREEVGNGTDLNTLIINNQNVGELNRTMLTVEYIPDTKFFVPSDDIEHFYNINEKKINAEYEYLAIPKNDNAGFVSAKIADWGNLDLISGNANLYFENSLAGQRYIYSTSVDDTLNLVLVRDEKVSVKREQIKSYKESKMLSSDKYLTYGYKIKVKNNRTEPIKIVVMDQYPISNHEDITVELLESSDAEIDKNQGFLTWRLNIAPGKSKELEFVYKIVAPENTIINR